MVLAAALPVRGLVGGLMIGSASAAMLLGIGRIAGVSGLGARVFGLARGVPWPIAAAFVAGLPFGAAGMVPIVGGFALRFPASLPVLLAGGLLVGFGTRLGGGCTSGHGVCGLSRLSFRSVVATAGFMAAGLVTVAAWRLAGLPW